MAEKIVQGTSGVCPPNIPTGLEPSTLRRFAPWRCADRI